MLKFFHLAIIMVAVYLPDQTWAMPALVAINILFSIMFYWLCFGLLTGLKASAINDEIDVADAWTSRVVQTGATLVMFMSGDTMIIALAAFSLPWIITNLFTDTFATLVKWDILEVTDKE